MTLLVIDACVARTCGDENATTQDARNCRDMLYAVLNNWHRLVLTRSIRAEWVIHSSRFARKIKRDMAKRGQIHVMNDPLKHGLLARVLQSTDNEETKKMLEKDFRYVAAALDADKTIISCDRQARRGYCVTSSNVLELRAIVWVNPCDQTQRPFEWISQGAIADPRLMLM